MPPEVRIERGHCRKAEDGDEQQATKHDATGDLAEDARLAESNAELRG
jgi:hypothetical protein